MISLRKLSSLRLRPAVCIGKEKLGLLNNACAVTTKFSTDVKPTYPDNPSPVYELRMYRANPLDFRKVLDHYQKNIDLRLKYSKMFGFWTTEIGDSVTQIVHIWEYDSLSHRRQVRNAMAGDQQWTSEFLPKLLPMLQVMNSYLMVPAPRTNITLNFKNDPNAVYELQTVDRTDSKSLSLTCAVEGEILIGRFLGVLGPTNTEYRLWRYPNIDAALAGSWKRTVDCPEEGTSQLLYPAAFSTIK